MIISTTPHMVFETLMDSEKHSELTGSNANISRETGGSFEVWDGYIEGNNIDIVPDKKIVQNWLGEEECWPKGHYSVITIELEEVKDGTRLDFTQEDMPADCYDNFYKGWYDNYWNPMQEIFKK
ncbi:MAG: SRPBCC domain-containing protein [Candidatus Humimicrobiaceae bacterium]